MIKREKVDFVELARLLMFGSHEFIIYLKEKKIKFRKGKTSDDLNNVKRKAMKNGMGKVEYELSMLELYLQDVFMKWCIPRNK